MAVSGILLLDTVTSAVRKNAQCSGIKSSGASNAWMNVIKKEN